MPSSASNATAGFDLNDLRMRDRAPVCIDKQFEIRVMVNSIIPGHTTVLKMGDYEGLVDCNSTCWGLLQGNHMISQLLYKCIQYVI